MNTQKRLLLAAVLCVAVILLYQLFFRPAFNPDTETAGETDGIGSEDGETDGIGSETGGPSEHGGPSDNGSPPQGSAPPTVGEGDVERQTHRIQSDLLALEVQNGAGGLIFDAEPLFEQFELDGRGVDFLRLRALELDTFELGFVNAQTDFAWGRRAYEVVDKDATSITLASRTDEVAVTQKLTLLGGYEARYEVTVHNLAPTTTKPLSYAMELRTRMGLPNESNRYDIYRGMCRSSEDGVEDYTKDDVDDEPATHHAVDWIGLDSNYFLSAVVPDDGFDVCRVSADLERGEGRDALEVVGETDSYSVAPQESRTHAFGVYLGVKDKDILAAFVGQGHKAEVSLSEAIDWGWFGIVSENIGGLMLEVLRFFYRLTGVWGVAIIMLTATVKLILLPLTLKQYRSMRKMQEIQPELTVIREKYKDDKQKMNQEVQALFQRSGVNPLAGCLPIFMQFPIWIALYSMLQHAVELYNTPFLWLADLTKTDPMHALPLGLGGLMFLQMRIQPQAGDPQQAKMMKIFMPIFFVVMFWFMPSGLGVYIFANMVLSLIQSAIQLRARKGGDDNGAADASGDSKSAANHAKPKKS